MAITHVTSATVSGTGTTATLTLPAAAQTGDLVEVNISINANKAASIASTGGAFTSQRTGSDGNVTNSIWYRVVQAGDVPGTTTFSWTWTGSEVYDLACSISRGVDTTTPEDAAVPSYTIETSTTPTSTSITTVTNDALLVAVMTADGPRSPTSPTDYTERAKSQANRTSAIATKILATAGASGVANWEISGTNIANLATHAALRPASGAGPQTISPGGIASTVVIGSHVLAAIANIFPSSIQPAQKFGTTIGTVLPYEYWPLGEASGNRVGDIRGIALEPTNAPTQVVGKIGNAVQFVAASEQYLKVPWNTFVERSNGFTVFCWVKHDTITGSQSIVSKWNNDTMQNEFILQQLSGVVFRVWIARPGFGQTSIDATMNPAVDTWYFVCMWLDVEAGTINVQVNNGTIYSAAWTNGVDNLAAPFIVGARGNGGATIVEYTDGIVDGLGIVNRALSAAERTAIYDSGVAGTEPVFSNYGTKINLHISPNTVAPTNVVSSPVITSIAYINPTSILSSLIIGNHALAQIISPVGISSTLSFGTPNIVQILSPTSILSSLVIGNHVLTSIAYINPSSIASTLMFGTPNIVQAISSPSILSTLSIGSHVLANIAYIAPSSILSTLVIGAHELTNAVIVNPNSILSSLTIGNPNIVQTIHASSIESALDFGSHIISSLDLLLPSSIPSSLSIGSHILTSILTIRPENIAPTTVIGNLTLVNILSPIGIDSELSLGNPVLSLFNAINPSSTISETEFGIHKLNLTIFPNSLDNINQFGLPIIAEAVLVTIISPVGIDSSLTIGYPRLILNAICFYDWRIGEYIWIPSEFIKTIPEVIVSQGPYPGKHDWTT